MGFQWDLVGLIEIMTWLWWDFDGIFSEMLMGFWWDSMGCNWILKEIKGIQKDVTEI